MSEPKHIPPDFPSPYSDVYWSDDTRFAQFYAHIYEKDVDEWFKKQKDKKEVKNE